MQRCDLLMLSEAHAEALCGGAGRSKVPPGLVGADLTPNAGQQQAAANGAFAVSATVADGQVVAYQRTFKNGKTVSWGSAP
jgi:hypothetical protein